MEEQGSIGGGHRWRRVCARATAKARDAYVEDIGGGARDTLVKEIGEEQGIG